MTKETITKKKNKRNSSNFVYKKLFIQKKIFLNVYNRKRINIGGAAAPHSTIRRALLTVFDVTHKFPLLCF